VAITGIGLVTRGDWHWRGLVLVGIAMMVVGAVTGVAGFDRLFRKECEARAAGDEATAQRATHNITSLAAMDTFLLLLTMLAMIDKWKAF
jgi:hypothetical protein